ncbi:MAG: hypothetical protein OXC80_08820 [Gammaproteobacteria bacterium]|nr:hypothetical protein [Gammaproteobacteria bacterium]
MLVTVAIGLLVFNAVFLLLWWLIFPEQIESNGSQIFFVVLWLMMSGLLYLGAGWVRYASVVLGILFVLAWYNTAGNNMDTYATMLAKGISLTATVLLFLPPSHRWFRWIFKSEIVEEQREVAERNGKTT